MQHIPTGPCKASQLVIRSHLHFSPLPFSCATCALSLVMRQYCSIIVFLSVFTDLPNLPLFEVSGVFFHTFRGLKFASNKSVPQSSRS